MKIAPSTTGTFSSVNKGAQDGAEIGGRTFGRTFQQHVSGALRYDASATAGTRSFSEMPIVAPAAVDIADDARSTHGAAMPADNGRPPLDTEAHDSNPVLSADLLAENIVAQFPKAEVHLLAVDDVRHGRRTEPVAVSATTQPSSARQRTPSTRAEAIPIEARTPVHQARHMQPFSVQLWRASRGVTISISAGNMSDDEQRELAAQVTEMARSCGVAIDELRISRSGRGAE